MKRSLLLNTAIISLAATAMGHAGQLITFDNISTSANYAAMPAGYAGFNWDNFGVIAGQTFPGPNGYTMGFVSAPNVAFNENGSPASFSAGGPFTLSSLWLAGAWNDGLNVTITGYTGAHVPQFVTTVQVVTEHSTQFTLGWTGIDEVDFNSFGGTPQGYNGAGTQIVMDNISINGGVPDAGATSVLFGMALAGLGVARRKFVA